MGFAKSWPVLTRTAKLVLGLLHQAVRDPTLVVLNVRLLFREGKAIVHFALEGIGNLQSDSDTAEHDNSFAVPWEITYSEFPSLDSTDPDRELPPSLAEDLRFRLARVIISEQQPLWLRLIKPYGWLGTLPWERALTNALHRPVLRLPDFPRRPTERADVHQNVLIVDPGPEADAAKVRHSVEAMARAIVSGSSRSNTQVHVFPTRRWYPELQRIQRASQVIVYEARRNEHKDEGKDEHQPVTSAPLSDIGIAGWTDWVIRTMGQEGIDALHFFGRAVHRETCGCILVSADPTESRKHTADIEIDVAEFDLLMNRAGSWAATFAPAAPDYWPALAHFADSLARIRPCAVFCTALSSGGAGDELSATYHLLFGGKPGPAPLLHDGFLYCHPSFVTDTAGLAQPELLHALSQHALVLARRAPAVQRLLHTVTNALPGVRTTNLSAPPNWAVSTQRFLEAAAFHEWRRCSEDVLLSKARTITSDPQATPQLDSDTAKILNEIQGVVDGYANKSDGV